ncbi:Cell growth-regulating nucleolar protein [Amphibalanus amphitrite]|uniref:Cell growth-regulating nucleolar protein n=1 Tax=Amphibalanus amphitrite TaxID=1232801 RepID=A0A6A4X8D4_AMPAM|nr:Cell growth-regulating nucleolar protein [Amphibalanus amphitrite]
MDCGKDFWGEDYKQHNKCISEEAKYAAKGWEPKASANKGERKQEAWIESINNVVGKTTDISPAVRDLLATLSQHSNIPRKKKKFLNFVSNSIRVRNSVLVEEAWKIFEAAIAKPAEEAPAATASEKKKENGASQSQETESKEEMLDNATSKKKKKKKANSEPIPEETVSEDAPVVKKSKREKKMERSKKKNKLAQNGAPEENGVKQGKRKHQEADDDVDEGIPDEECGGGAKKRKLEAEPAVERLNDTLDESSLASAQASKKFDWTGVVLALLGNRDDHELSLKKLRKKVVSEYECRGCEGKPNTSKEEIWAKLDKKLKKMPQVKVIRDNVKLVSV